MPAKAGIQYSLCSQRPYGGAPPMVRWLLDRPPARAMTPSVWRPSRLRQLEVDVPAVDDDVLDEYTRLDLCLLYTSDAADE